MHERLTIVTDVRGVSLSVSLSVCHATKIGDGACSVRRVQCTRGHSVQLSPNVFGI